MSLHLQRLEQEIERLRLEIYESVSAEPSRLTDAYVLWQSQQLDRLIVKWTQTRKQGISHPIHLETCH